MQKTSLKTDFKALSKTKNALFYLLTVYRFKEMYPNLQLMNEGEFVQLKKFY